MMIGWCDCRSHSFRPERSQYCIFAEHKQPCFEVPSLFRLQGLLFTFFGCERVVNYMAAVMQADISDIYLLAKSTKGVFVNIALQEPFGLTLIEAAVHGAPIVATRHGGPVDIIATLKVRLIYPYPAP